MQDTAQQALKEITGLRESFQHHMIEDQKRFGNLDDSMAKMNTNVEEILDIMRAFHVGKSFVVGSGILIGSVIAIVVGLKEILAWLK